MFTIKCLCKSCEYESTGMITIEIDDPDAMALRDELLERYPVEPVNRFAEPDDPGVYFTQSGVALYNDGEGGCQWLRCDGKMLDYASDMRRASWPVVVSKFPPSEFPLRKAVSEP